MPSAKDRGGLKVQPLTPRLFRKLAVVIRRDKRLHRGLRETIQAIKGLSDG
jgi:hypothetical protein